MQMPVHTDAPSGVSESLAKFEAFLVQNFVEAMLPRNAEHVFGKGTAGGIWKSLLAEKVGMEIARSGQLGITRQIAQQGIGKPVEGNAN